MLSSLGSKKTRLNIFSAVASTLTLVSVSSVGCPDLGKFYQLLDEAPASAAEQLMPYLEECSQSSEYFALLGASQLAVGNLLQALENLELALLIDPGNGSASVDYAEVLFSQGQILSALEINEQLLARGDLPEGLRESLVARQRRWGRSTIQTSFSAAGFLGFDNNLNSAPVSDQLSLTLSGNSVTLDVSPEYQATEGGYTRLVGSANMSRIGQSINSQLSGQLRGRFSQDSRYELVQASTQGIFSQARDNPAWDGVIGFDHVVFGGNAIFSSATLRARYLVKQTESCDFYPRVAVQYQYFNSQRSLSGVEHGLGLGADCRFLAANQYNRVAFEMTAIVNEATENNRLGADRNGWRLNLLWRRSLGRGEFLGQFVQTRLDDQAGYSALFQRGAKRKETLNSLFFQYMRPLRGLNSAAQFFSNLSYYSQDSTIDLFKTRGTSLEVGINWNF